MTVLTRLRGVLLGGTRLDSPPSAVHSAPQAARGPMQGFVFSLLGFLLGFAPTPVTGVVLVVDLIGLVLSLVDLRRARRQGLSTRWPIIGVVLAAAGICMVLVWWALFISARV